MSDDHRRQREPLTPERFRELIEEGQKLRARFDKDSAGMRILTHKDRSIVSR